MWFKNRLGRLPRIKLPLVLSIILGSLLILACEPTPSSTFDTAGPIAELQANLLYYVFIIAAVVFVIVEGLIIYIVFKYRRRRNDEMPEQVHGNTKLEIIWTVIPAIIIIAIAIPTVQGIWSVANAGKDENRMTIEAIGHQWWFEFRYPSMDIVTANDLYIPTGQWIQLELSSQDVIHSFWVPRLFGKEDMIPNRTTFINFRADEPGEYIGQCAEFCGIAHGKMQFRVIALPPEEFEAWGFDWFNPPEPLSEDAQAGQILFATNCATCHTTNSYVTGGYEREIQSQAARWFAWTEDPLTGGSRIVSAPDLTHFGTRTTVGAGTLELSYDNLFTWVKDPSAIKFGTRMQNHAAVYLANSNIDEPTTADNTTEAALSDTEIGQIVDYLLELVPGSDDSAQNVTTNS